MDNTFVVQQSFEAAASELQRLDWPQRFYFDVPAGNQQNRWIELRQRRAHGYLLQAPAEALS